MSAFSLAYSDMRTLVAALLPAHSIIPNAYEIDENDDTDLEKSWGFKVSSGANTNRVIAGKATIERDFTLVIARQVFAVESDVTKRIETEEFLFGDQELIIEKIEKVPSTTNIIKIVYNDDAGLEFKNGEDENFLILETPLLVEYKKDL